MTKPTIVLDKRTIAEQGILLHQLIKISDLGYYGFDAQIINEMVEYDIFPQVYKYRGSVYVAKDTIFGIVGTFIRNALTLYKAVDGAEKAKVEMLAEMEKYGVPYEQLVAYTDQAKEEAAEIGIDLADEANADWVETRVKELIDANRAPEAEQSDIAAG